MSAKFKWVSVRNELPDKPGVYFAYDMDDEYYPVEFYGGEWHPEGAPIVEWLKDYDYYQVKYDNLRDALLGFFNSNPRYANAIKLGVFTEEERAAFKVARAAEIEFVKGWELKKELKGI